MTIMLRRLVLVGGSSLLAAGCGSSPEPGLYTLQVRPGTPASGGPAVVQVREVSIAAYLDRKEIVRSAQDYKLAVQSNDWWGENLGQMLGRVIVMGLAQRLPASQVLAEGGAVPADPRAIVGVSVQRLDVHAAGQLVLVAQAGVEIVRTQRKESRRFEISRRPGGPDTRALVAAISDAVGELTDGLAQMLRA
jgi:hypothetical protein